MLAVDVGRRWIGLAGCDPLGISVRPLGVLRRQQFDINAQQVRGLCRQRQVEALIVGLPLLADGSEGSQSRQSRRYGQRLSSALSLPLAFVDERCSTWAAAQTPQLASRLATRGNRRLDSAAAVFILVQWLAEGPEPVLSGTSLQQGGVVEFQCHEPLSAAPRSLPLR